ncbi:MAG: 5-(carboxyamino)imidazole ribonucleotide mutase [bacterium]|jgi:5-(carboxyamino)imidazole ribonucleotide mutase|nr:5-(carboxyamino)imidazole ribonucleotide mutase [bacterium]MDD3805401.1 5-(carboxyamino)imidazole ribonucleotide mutase [bacterium]MDD4558125.1 5-(carboxyamino)imidazole ribonucleotide mutase [bacterium]
MNVRVGIIMGSDSDLPVMREAALVLEELGVECELEILSAHRTPEKAAEYAKNAAGRGLAAIIAGAGGAAHLAGVMAAFTELPVIGVPIKTAALGGVDSLYSIVQMPAGIPVGAMAINGARNAGIYAAQILALSDEELKVRFIDFRRRMSAKVLEKNAALKEKGWRE